MPRTKSKDGNKPWSSTGLTLFVFFLLIATGLVIAFGVIQQLGYIAWERSLQQTERSLAAEKELVRRTNELRELFEQYQTNPLSLSEEQIQNEVAIRQDGISKLLPDNPDSVVEILQDWSNYQIPAHLSAQLESSSTKSFTVLEYITKKQQWYLYIIRTTDNQDYDLYTQQEYQRNQTITSTLYTMENIAFERND